MLCNCLNHALHEIAVSEKSCVRNNLVCLATGGGWRSEDGRYSSASDTDCENSSSSGHPSHTSRVRLAALSCLQVTFSCYLTCHLLCLLCHLCLCAGASKTTTRDGPSRVQALAKVDCKALHPFWVSLLPVHSPLARRPDSLTLMDAILNDPSPKVFSSLHPYSR